MRAALCNAATSDQCDHAYLHLFVGSCSVAQNNSRPLVMAYLSIPCLLRLGSGAVHPGRLPTLVLLLLVPFTGGTLGDLYEPLVAAPQGVRTLREINMNL